MKGGGIASDMRGLQPVTRFICRNVTPSQSVKVDLPDGEMRRELGR